MSKWIREIPFALVRIGKTYKGLKYPIVLLLMIMKAICEVCNAAKILTYSKLHRRVLASVLALCMVFTLLPINAFAAEPTQSMGTLCKHHTSHTPECGYIEGIEGTPCTHEHTDDCYKTEMNCVHSHTEDCYDKNEEIITDTDQRMPVNCTHRCSKEAGCVTEELYCLHEQDKHDDTCGFTQGTDKMPCTYICELCNQLTEQQICNCQTADSSGLIHEESCPLYVDELPAGQSDTVQAAQELINKLPTVDKLGAEDKGSEKFPAYLKALQTDTAAARSAYDALSAEDKEGFDSTVLGKLTALEEWLKSYVPQFYVLNQSKTAGAITIQVNDSGTANGTTLAAAVAASGVEADGIKKLTVTAGNVTAADWKALKTTLPDLTDLTIAKEVKVADIPDKVTNMNQQPYSGTFPATIVSVTIPQEIKIGEFAFAYCKFLKEVNIPHATSIGDWAFYYCYELTTVEFPEVIYFGDMVFYTCKVLTDVSFPKAASIGEKAFYDCELLSGVSFPEATSISNEAFSGCSALKTVSFPKVTSIGEGAFTAFDNGPSSCESLEEAKFPKAVSIGNYAFSSAKLLKTISFPQVKSIGDFAFNECISLEKAYFPNAISIGAWSFFGCKVLETADFPKAESIASSVFYRCTALKTVSFPKVTSIDSKAFLECSALKTVSFPEVTSIGYIAFSNCTALTKASFPKAGYVAGQMEPNFQQEAFSGCLKFTTLLLGSTPPYVYYNADNVFKDCPKDRTINFVAADGTGLSKDKLTAAQAEYKKDNDSEMTGEAANNATWYGWKIGGTLPETVPAPGGKITSPLTQENVNAVFGEGNAAVDTNSGKITINHDITVSGTIVIECAPILIDLSGHKITGEPGVGTFTLAVNSKALTIKGPGSILAGTDNHAVSGTTGSQIIVDGGAMISGGNGTGNGNGGDGIHTRNLKGRMVYQTSRSAENAVGKITISNGAIAGGNGSGSGSGGNGLSADGDILVNCGTVRGGAGGSGGTSGGNGGSGLSCSGSVTVDFGVTVRGGNGGIGTIAGGNGGNGIIGSDITIDGDVTGGAGGDGAEGSNGFGGFGGSGVNQEGGTIGGKGTVSGGSGGNGDGTGSAGRGGDGISGGADAASGVTVVNGKLTKLEITGDAKTGVKSPNGKDAANAVLTPEEKKDNTITEVKAVLHVENQNSPADKDKVEEVLSGIDAKTIGAFFDITLEKVITKDGSTLDPVSVTDTGEEIEITIPIPTHMQGGSNYKVIRVHNNAGQVLTTSELGNELTFKTDKFSTYAIAYTPKSTPTPDPTPAPDEGGSGSSSSGSSSGGFAQGDTVTPNAPITQVKAGTSEITVTAPVDQNGNAIVTLSDKMVADAIKAAQDAVKKDNTQGGMINVLIKVETDMAATQLTFTMPHSVQEALINNKVNSFIITSNVVTMSFSKMAIEQINSQAKADITITSAKADAAWLTGNAKTAIGSRPVFSFTVSTVNGEKISSFGAGSVSVAIPYAPGANENAGNIQAVYVDDFGNMEWLKNSFYDSRNKVLHFSTNHFSTYGVGCMQDAPDFTDIGDHWAKTDIEFAANRGLISGISPTTFCPNTAMTRGMFVTALGRLTNADVSSYNQSIFSDVANDAYYMGYTQWADKNGIVNGGADGKFLPDAAVTREQMAVILSSFAKAIGFSTPNVHAENTFTDSANISAYAKDAVKQMQMAGVLAGKIGNVFDPQGTATRAEVSAVLRRFMELMISGDTAQGWTMNDSGQWMYYENGSPVIGQKTIDGMAYTFGQYGVVADVPKNEKYRTYTVQKGDNFWKIAKRFSCTMSELEQLNNKSRFDIIYPGDVLSVPEK